MGAMAGAMVGCGSEGMSVPPEDKAAAQTTREAMKKSHQALSKESEALRKDAKRQGPGARKGGGRGLMP